MTGLRSSLIGEITIEKAIVPADIWLIRGLMAILQRIIRAMKNNSKFKIQSTPHTKIQQHVATQAHPICADHSSARRAFALQR